MKLRRRAIIAALMALVILIINAIATMKTPAQEKKLIRENAAKEDDCR
ncbi:MAG TPA: hypothetical protein VID27_07395 [Blastocatellia bacterium]